MSSPAAGTERAVRGFDRLAPIYDLLADVAFLGRIHSSQVALLPRVPRGGQALVLGGGGGRFLAELLASGAAAHAVSIDISPAMTGRTAARLKRRGLARQAELRVGGLGQLGSTERFDLIVTHCFLDLFKEPELTGVVATLEAALAPGGAWLFSDFSTAGAGVPGFVRRAIVASLYAFFRLTFGIDAHSLPDFGQAFARAGLQTTAEKAFAGGLLRAALFHKDLVPNSPGRKTQVSFL